MNIDAILQITATVVTTVASIVGCLLIIRLLWFRVKWRFETEESDFVQMLKDGDLQRGDMFVEDYRDHPEDDGATFLHVILQNNTEVGYIRHALTTEIALEEMERNELEIHIINDADREGYDELKRRDRQIRKLKGHPRYIPKPQRRVGFKLRATTEEREFTHDEVRPDIKRRDL